jgi:hypothetical protein
VLNAQTQYHTNIPILHKRGNPIAVGQQIWRFPQRQTYATTAFKTRHVQARIQFRRGKKSAIQENLQQRKTGAVEYKLFNLNPEGIFDPTWGIRPASISNLHSLYKKQQKQMQNPSGVSTFMQRVKNIYGKGQIYKLRKDLNEEVDDKLKNVISALKSDKTLGKSYTLNRKKLTHSEIENLFQLNHEVNTVRGLEGWLTSSYHKQTALGKIRY